MLLTSSQFVFFDQNGTPTGSLKFDNLKQATDEINEIIKQKYALLNKVKGKSRLAKKYPDVERYYADMADQAGFAFAISEADLAGASFIKLKHKKVSFKSLMNATLKTCDKEALIRTLKSEGRIQEKRRAKKPSLYCLISPITKQLVWHLFLSIYFLFRYFTLLHSELTPRITHTFEPLRKLTWLSI